MDEIVILSRPARMLVRICARQTPSVRPAAIVTAETTNALSLRLSAPTTGNHTPFGLVHPAAAIFLLDPTSSAHNYG